MVARNLHEVAERRTIDLEGCEDARRALETAVEGIRARLAGLGEDTAAALSEEQARLRTTTAEVRALRQSTSQTEARVIAMREFTAQRMAVLAARRREIADQEVNREIGSAGEDADLWVRRQTAGLSPLCMVDTATPKKTACKTVSAGTKANSTFRARKGSNVKKDASSIISRRAAALR